MRAPESVARHPLGPNPQKLVVSPQAELRVRQAKLQQAIAKNTEILAMLPESAVLSMQPKVGQGLGQEEGQGQGQALGSATAHQERLARGVCRTLLEMPGAVMLGCAICQSSLLSTSQPGYEER